MKATISLVFATFAVLAPLHAQEHLVPEAGTLATSDQYHSKVQEVLKAAYEKEVICRVVILVSGPEIPEKVVGVRTTASGHEVFKIIPASSIWDTELIRFYEAGEIQTFDKDMKKLSLAQNEDYQALKKRTPEDFRKIATVTKAVLLDDGLARRVAALWKRMLLATRHPKEARTGADGSSYHFSMFVLSRGDLGGNVWSPDEKTKTAALVDLSDALSRYASGLIDAGALKKIVSRVEKVTKG